MKISNLKENMILKNYKQLCEVLEIPVKAGDSKKAQFKELERYCEYHKEGNKIVIDTIFTEVKEKMDNRTIVKENDKRRDGNNNQQAKCIRYLLLNLLSQYQIGDNEVIGFSKGLLLKKLHMTNDNYRIAKTSRSKYAKALAVEELAINECFDYFENNSISAIRRAITTLKSQSIIGYKYSFSWVDQEGYIHHCSTREENTIQTVELYVMEEMKIRNKHKIWEFGRWDEFKRKVTEKLNEECNTIFPQLKYYFYSFHFNYNYESIQKQMRYMEQRQEMTYETALEGVQELWSNSLDKTIDNRHKKAKEIIAWGEGLCDIDNYRISDNYKTEQTKIKDSIVKLDYPTVVINEKKTKELNEIEVPF